MRRIDPGIVLADLCLTNVVGAASQAESPAGTGEQEVVTTVAVTRADLLRMTTQPPTVDAYFEARISAKVSGYLNELRVDIGQNVQGGEALAVINVPVRGGAPAADRAKSDCFMNEKAFMPSVDRRQAQAA